VETARRYARQQKREERFLTALRSVRNDGKRQKAKGKKATAKATAKATDPT
jgi:hypothetical protein